MRSIFITDDVLELLSYVKRMEFEELGIVVLDEEDAREILDEEDFEELFPDDDAGGCQHTPNQWGVCPINCDIEMPF